MIRWVRHFVGQLRKAVEFERERVRVHYVPGRREMREDRSASLKAVSSLVCLFKDALRPVRSAREHRDAAGAASGLMACIWSGWHGR